MATSSDKTEKSQKTDRTETDSSGSSGSAGSSGSSGTSYLNTTNSPLAYDREGHLVGGGEWTPEIHLDAVGKAARAAGHLAPRSAL